MSENMKFRKKPVVIEAVRWTGDNLFTVASFTGNADAYSLTTEDGEVEFYVRTLEGEMHASRGDWIIRGVQGELYPCKPDIFAATYEPATSSPHPQPTAAEVEAAVETLREVIRRDDWITDAEMSAWELIRSALSRSVSDGEDGARLDFLDRHPLTFPLRHDADGWRTVRIMSLEAIGPFPTIREALDAARTPSRGEDQR